MIHFRLVFLLLSLFLVQSCKEKSTVISLPLHADLVPDDAEPLAVNIQKVNSWVEQDKFFVTGICSNTTAGWQKIWLNVTPLDGSGKPITIANHSSVIVPTFSDAVPPYGRTSFYAFWPLSEFSGKPASCNIKVAGVVRRDSGAILIVPISNGMKMMTPVSAGQSATVDRGWLVGGTLSNPLDMVATAPRLEVLIFGTDNQLWMSTVLHPDDPAIQQIFSFDRQGPLQPKEERGFTLQVLYNGLPQVIKEKSIGRVEILPFVAR